MSCKFAQRLDIPGVVTDIILDERTVYDLEMLQIGAFAPLKGFNSYDDFCSIVTTCRLTTGEVWPIPILCPFSSAKPSETSENVQVNTRKGSVIKLRDMMNLILAEMVVDDCFQITDLDLMSKGLLGSADSNHPYKKYLMSLDSLTFVGGAVKWIHDIKRYDFPSLRLTPAQVKEEVSQKQWKHVAGFQTRNPMHKSHVILTLKALAKISAANNNERVTLLITPVCGITQHRDIPYHIRVRCYKEVLPHYAAYASALDFIGDVKIVLIPLSMRMAGPREALMHALIRKNYGCTHFIVGRDHAGPSSVKSDGSTFYGAYEAQAFLESFAAAIGIKPVLGQNIVYVDWRDMSKRPLGPLDLMDYVEEDEIDSEKMVVHSISGTKLRQALQKREPIPSWYSFPGVVRALQQHYKPLNELGLCIYFTGLPCSGKTTLASAVQAILLENETEKRHVTLLDADIIRTQLSKGLGFDRESRKLHVQRIGYVCSLVVQSGGICLVANIAPYAADRQNNREMITATEGGYVEVYVSTPLEVCEHRDVKGQYKNARLGIVQKFTGISDPYEVPVHPELTINSSENIHEKAMIVIDYLKEKKWVI